MHVHCFTCLISTVWASLVAQLVKNPPAMQETWVRSLGWEDPLEDLKGQEGPRGHLVAEPRRQS